MISSTVPFYLQRQHIPFTQVCYKNWSNAHPLNIKKDFFAAGLKSCIELIKNIAKIILALPFVSESARSIRTMIQLYATSALLCFKATFAPKKWLVEAHLSSIEHYVQRFKGNEELGGCEAAKDFNVITDLDLKHTILERILAQPSANPVFSFYFLHHIDKNTLQENDRNSLNATQLSSIEHYVQRFKGNEKLAGCEAAKDFNVITDLDLKHTILERILAQPSTNSIFSLYFLHHIDKNTLQDNDRNSMSAKMIALKKSYFSQDDGALVITVKDKTDENSFTIQNNETIFFIPKSLAIDEHMDPFKKILGCNDLFEEQPTWDNFETLTTCLYFFEKGISFEEDDSNDQIFLLYTFAKEHNLSHLLKACLTEMKKRVPKDIVEDQLIVRFVQQLIQSKQYDNSSIPKLLQYAVHFDLKQEFHLVFDKFLSDNFDPKNEVLYTDILKIIYGLENSTHYLLDLWELGHNKDITSFQEISIEANLLVKQIHSFSDYRELSAEYLIKNISTYSDDQTIDLKQTILKLFQQNSHELLPHVEFKICNEENLQAFIQKVSGQGKIFFSEKQSLPKGKKKLFLKLSSEGIRQAKELLPKDASAQATPTQASTKSRKGNFKISTPGTPIKAASATNGEPDYNEELKDLPAYESLNPDQKEKIWPFLKDDSLKNMPKGLANVLKDAVPALNPYDKELLKAWAKKMKASMQSDSSLPK